MGQWVLGALMGLLSLIGLLLASRAHEGALYVVGLLLFAFGVAFNYWLVARNTGKPIQRRDH